MVTDTPVRVQVEVEGAFSRIKRIVGEYVSAKKFVNMTREMAMKAAIYNRFIAMV
jgi:hypothetical protein